MASPLLSWPSQASRGSLPQLSVSTSDPDINGPIASSNDQTTSVPRRGTVAVSPTALAHHTPFNSTGHLVLPCSPLSAKRMLDLRAEAAIQALICVCLGLAVSQGMLKPGMVLACRQESKRPALILRIVNNLGLGWYF